MNVVEQCAAGIGGIGRMDFATGKAPQQKAVNCAKGEFAIFGLLPSSGIIENPADFGT